MEQKSFLKALIWAVLAAYVSRRKFYPNLHSVKTVEADGTVVRKKVCAKCLKAGKVKKA